MLYSGGKDSSLAAYILNKLGYEIRLLNANFGILDSWRHAEEAAYAIGFDFEVKKFERKIVMEALEMILQDGYPRRGINYIHRRVLEEVAKEYDIIADGTRRDDKAPCLDLSEIRSIEDRYDIEYIAPLRGIGYKTLNSLARMCYEFEEGNALLKGDYESEIRYLLKSEGKKEEDYFPKHIQTKVIRRI